MLSTQLQPGYGLIFEGMGNGHFGFAQRQRYLPNITPGMTSLLVAATIP
ncbi:MAG: hypothetical protein H6667_07795 [Ardenticatenaceae bacterium]|nr:hypothetical protein [Ardenticatenaceae bacterium]MCB9443843.1 hypothetical protein [Ardenticatenaceae bacterium]